MKKQTIAAVLAAAMLTPTAYAADWVYVSSWAYNDVSNFTNEGLLPDTFADVSDYRAPATLEQICEILYSVGASFGEVMERDGDSRFKSTYSIVNHLAALQLGEKVYIEIPEGIVKFSDEEIQFLNENYGHTHYRSDDWYGQYYVDLDINAPITRGEAALVFDDCYELWIPHSNLGGNPDGGEYPIVDGAPDAGAVYWCKQNGVMDAESDTYGLMTIEQAIVAAYRMYLSHPSVSRPDSSEDGYIKTYSNGIEEHRLGNNYVLKRNGEDIAVFETDIYKNIYCTDTNDGRTLAAAEHILKHTDIYDLATGSVIATIPYRTDSLKDNCIITKQATENGMIYGACGFDGTVFLEPCYSRFEVDTLHSAGFGSITEEPRIADGWLYFINEDCRLYRVDTNGENEVCMSNMRFKAFQYKNGTLYCHALNSDGEKLWAMNADGSGVELISEDLECFYGYDTDDFSNTVYKDFGEWIYYLTDDGGYEQLMRVKREDDTYIKECEKSGSLLDTGRMSLTEKKLLRRLDDENYSLKYSSGDMQIVITDHRKNEEFTADFFVYSNVYGRSGNILFVTSLSDNGFFLYDMDKRSIIKEFDDRSGNCTVYKDLFIYHTPTGNTKVFNMADTDLSPFEVYPCKGIYRYGELEDIVLLGDRKPHKVMKNGFYLPLTSQTVSDYALVMN